MVFDWTPELIGNVADSISVTHGFEKNQLIFLNTSDILNGEILHRNYSAVETFPGQAKKSICRNDILYSEIRPANGRYAFIDFDADDYIVSTKLMVIRARKTILPRYLYLFLTSRQTTGWLQHLAEARSGTFPQITFDQVTPLEVGLPPIPAQDAIVKFIEVFDKRIELNRRMNQTLEQMAAAIFKAWFVDFEPVAAKADGAKNFPSMPQKVFDALPTEFTDSPLGPIPEGWILGTVQNLGTVICGKTPPTKEPANYGSEIPFITIPDMHGRAAVTATTKYLSVVGAATQANKTLPPLSICVSCIATPGLVVLTTEPSQTNQQINSVVPTDSFGPYYCYETLNRLGDDIRRSGSGGSVFSNLSKGRFEKLPLVLPSSNLSKSFGKAVAPMFELIISNQRESETLAQIRDALLPKLLSGEIRVGEAERIAEEVA